MTEEPSAALERLIDSAQRAAGVLAARHRGDPTGAAALMGSFSADAELAGGALLLADVAVRLLRQHTGESAEDCLAAVSLSLSLAGSYPHAD